jgi:hypothetical protein
VTTPPGPGWYPDPSGGPDKKYWNGEQWLAPTVNANRRSAGGAFFVILVIGLGIFFGAHACKSDPAQDAKDTADGAYIGDLDARGVPTGITNGTNGATLGRDVCTDLGAGSAADTKVLQVANLQINLMDEFTVPQAEMIVYWAVRDLCPQYASQAQDHWKDGS